MAKKAQLTEAEETKEMLDTLVELKSSLYWDAILRYTRQRDFTVMQSLRSIDPFKETTQMARIQGIGIGLRDLEGGVNEEISRRNKASEAEVTDKTSKAKK